MLFPIIKKQVKLALILIITVSNLLCTFHSFSQSLDTSKLIRAIESELKRQGVVSPKFELNVKSINQSGGQTAFIINNVVYGDTTFNIPNRDNIVYEFTTYENRKGIKVYPKKGRWEKPFVMYPKIWVKDSSMLFKIIHGSGMTNVGGGTITLGGKVYQIFNISSMDACTAALPLFIPIDYDLSFFIFGDRAYEDKWYKYDYKDVKYCPDFIGHNN